MLEFNLKSFGFCNVFFLLECVFACASVSKFNNSGCKSKSESTKGLEEKSDVNHETLDLHQESGISKMKDTKLIQFLDSMVPPLFDSMKFVFPQVKGEMRHRESFFGMPQSILLRQNMPIPDSCRCKYIIAADTN